MANFNVHFNTAIITTGLGSATLLSAEHIDLNSALWLWFLGTMGGLLPDIDSDNSTSLDVIFNFFALSAVFITLNFITTDLFTQRNLIGLILIPLIAYGVMRYLVRSIFKKITVHRGSCHSLFFLLFAALLTTQITWQINEQETLKSATFAWLSGGFIFFGGMVHLLLDEIYSVDLNNIRIKRSFGTALKLADFNNKPLTLMIIIAITGLVYIAPPTNEVILALSDWSKFKLYDLSFKV